MAAAARLFAERGYHPTSVSDVVESLGVGKGVFYWYFASKEELFVDIVNSSHHELRRRQAAAIGDEADPVRRIELGTRASLAWFAENRHLFNLFCFAATEERFAPVLRENEQIAVADVTRHLKEAMVQGRIADVDPDMVAHALIGVARHLARTYLCDASESVEPVADVAVGFSLHGLLGIGPASRGQPPAGRATTGR